MTSALKNLKLNLVSSHKKVDFYNVAPVLTNGFIKEIPQVKLEVFLEASRHIKTEKIEPTIKENNDIKVFNDIKNF